MGFLGKLLDATVNVVIAPIDVIKDVATLGGAMTDQDKPYTAQRLEKVIEKVEEAGEKAGDGDLL